MHVITAEELLPIKDSADIFFIDVRENDETAVAPYQQINLLHIPMNDVPARIDEIDFEKRIIVGCAMGGRSAKVCEYLESLGHTNVTNLIGGYKAWKELTENA